MNNKNPQHIHRQEQEKPFQSKEWKRAYPEVTPSEALDRELHYRLKAAPRQRRISVALFLLVLLPIFYFYTVQPFMEYFAAQRLISEGVRTEATIDKVSPQKRFLRISYHYTVDQKKYQGQGELFFHEGNLLVGHRIPLFYDPARPEVHQLAEDLHAGRLKARLFLTCLFSGFFLILFIGFPLLRKWGDHLSVRIVHTMARPDRPVSPRAVLEEVNKIPRSMPLLSALGGTGALLARMAFPARQRIYLGSWLWSFSPLAFPAEIFDTWFKKEDHFSGSSEEFLAQLDLLNHARRGYSEPVDLVVYQIPKETRWNSFDERYSLVSSYTGLSVISNLFQSSPAEGRMNKQVLNEQQEERFHIIDQLARAGPADRVILKLKGRESSLMLHHLHIENIHDGSTEEMENQERIIPLEVEQPKVGLRRLLLSEEEAAELICDALFFFYLCPWQWESLEREIKILQSEGDSIKLKLQFEPDHFLSIERILNSW